MVLCLVCVFAFFFCPNLTPNEEARGEKEVYCKTTHTTSNTHRCCVYYCFGVLLTIIWFQTRFGTI